MKLPRELILWWRRSLRARVQLHVHGERLTTAEIGREGELLAALWLRKHGRKVLYHNFSGPREGEVDIVCRHGKTLTFVEVKTRTSEKFGRPADAVDKEKQALIQRGAKEWMNLLSRRVFSFRFDIVEVILNEGERPVIRVIENAFQMPKDNMLGRMKTG